MKTRLTAHWNAVLKRYDVGSDVDGASEIAAWLADDLVTGVKSIEFWIEKLKSIANKKAEEGYLGSGNAHHVRAIDGFVFLECQFVDEMKVLLTYAQAIDALEQYEVFLKEETGDSISAPQPFEVEYESIGEEALDRYLAAGGKLGLA